MLENGAGLAGVTVRATAEGFERLAVTDSAGVYRMDGIPDGRYTLTPVGIGYRFEPPTLVTAVEGKDTEAAEFHAIRESPGAPVTVEGITFIPIPAGGFRMGSATGPKNERPLHTVTLDSLLAGATEITQGQYRSLTGKNPSYTSGTDIRPVEQVSWEEAAHFCNLLSDRIGLSRCYDETTWECDFGKNGFRLPTEAEWEYLCRAGTMTAYSSEDSEEALARAGWYAVNSGGITAPVGLKAPNAWGLFDMHGNIWEWCNDRYFGGYYQISPEYNPPGPRTGTLRVIRGGSWFSSPDECRSAFRGYSSPDFRYYRIGFRIVKGR